jgi:hypothetical protein
MLVYKGPCVKKCDDPKVREIKTKKVVPDTFLVAYRYRKKTHVIEDMFLGRNTCNWSLTSSKVVKKLLVI